MRKGWLERFVAIGLIAAGICPVSEAKGASAQTATRVFYQDDESSSLKWTDLVMGEQLQFGPVGEIAGFPKLDPKKQSLVQMEAARGMILVGVRDKEEGKFQSGWILIDTGVDEEGHGNHSHWYYNRPPRVRAKMLDDKQGNPAHLYQYQEVFYLANDKRNGFTRIDPGAIGPQEDEAAILPKAAFHRGGGNHITLAIFGNVVGYSAWIDREGENAGRVDVATLYLSGNTAEPKFFKLPSGGIHGATTTRDKVFFAPADGICWFVAPAGPEVDPSTIQVKHLSLGKEGEKPRRTGSFTTFQNYVGFTTGEGSGAAAYFMDATPNEISATRLDLKMHPANHPSGLEIVLRRTGLPLGFVFHSHPADVEAPDRLSLIDLDPNADEQWGDAKVVQELTIGKAKAEGHGGHHSLGFDADRRRGIFSCPGAGTLNVISIDNWKEAAAFKVGGIPTKVVVVGGRGGGHH